MPNTSSGIRGLFFDVWLVGFLVVLTLNGCSSNENRKEEHKPDPPKKLEVVKFVIIANGLADRALADGRLLVLGFDRQIEIDGPNPTEFTVTGFRHPDHDNIEFPPAIPGDLKPALFYNYQTFVTIEGQDGVGICDVLFDKSVTTERKFKLTNVKELGIVLLTGSGTRLAVNESAYRAFSASVVVGWEGELPNKAARIPE